MKQIYMKKKIYMGLIVISIFLAIQSYRYCIWSEEYTYQLQEIDNGVYVQYHRVFSTVPADNYEVVQVCFNQKEGLIPRSLLRNKLFQDMEEEIY